MSSNLPPGVSEGSIPGNTSDDFFLESVTEQLLDALDTAGIHPEEYAIVEAVGIAAVLAARKVTRNAVQEAIQEERLHQTDRDDPIYSRGGK